MTLAAHRPARDPAHAVEFDRVSRTFTIHHERVESFQDWFIQRFRRGQPASEEFWALRDATFAVRRGETLGVIGRNGAGKSTLLKLVTGILEPTGGTVRVSGRLYAMLELGAGFHPELSGRDNIYLNGSIYGFGRKAMRRKYQQIVEFAELEHFIDTPVKYYSSGMFVRLGFATAIHMDPEILVIDEVLAVGDGGFRRKCKDAMRALQRRGVTILFVSHDSEEVREFCHRVVLLSGGRVVADGATEDVLTAYARLQLHEAGHAALVASEPAPGSEHARAQFGQVVLRDAADQIVQATQPGAPLTADVMVLSEGNMALDVLLRWRTPLGLLLGEARRTLAPNGPDPADAAADRPADAAADRGARRLRCHYPAFPVQSGDVLLEAALCDPATGVVVDTAEARLTVDGAGGALFAFEHTWEQSAATPAAHADAAPLVAGAKGEA
ncbi:MAG TPA: ABC transporter ATP-binding protein [Thermomicrobiales bacterium]|nr:ABC transporter ATP-binding protein [Thermomicrobiales bacterium]